MTTEIFLKPKFTGARFDEHTLPVEVARDLAAYEMLVIDLAKHLFLQANPHRKRVPKGFEDGFKLHLQNVEEGSAIPVLVTLLISALPLTNSNGSYYAAARDLVAECVAAPRNELPSNFPQELLTHFNQLGRSLLPDESLEFNEQAVLTPQRRKALVLAASGVYEQEVELTGTIGEADWEKGTFRLRISEANQVTVPMPEGFHDKARVFGGRPLHAVKIRAVASYDHRDRLQKVISMESWEILLFFQLAEKIERLSSLNDGWFDGGGSALDKDRLAYVTERFVGLYPETVDLPSVFPTPEGNLLFEWDLPGDPSFDLDLLTLVGYFHLTVDEGDEVERDFSFQTDTDWSDLFSFLENTLGRI